MTLEEIEVLCDQASELGMSKEELFLSDIESITLYMNNYGKGSGINHGWGAGYFVYTGNSCGAGEPANVDGSGDGYGDGGGCLWPHNLKWMKNERR